MRKMMIGISPRKGEFMGITSYYDFDSYFKYVADNGGFPVMLGISDEAQAEDAAQMLDGLLITGGADVNPALYGQESNGSGTPNDAEDQSDTNLYNAFKKAGKPILLICRGLQIANVIEGGTLIQDIPSQVENSLNHNQRTYTPPIARDQFCHEMNLKEGTHLYEIFGDHYKCNSFHHQSVDRLADCFKLSAVSSEDGIVEGFEAEHITAVQWHPERHVTDDKHKQIMKDFLSDCALMAQKAR